VTGAASEVMTIQWDINVHIIIIISHAKYCNGPYGFNGATTTACPTMQSWNLTLC